MPAETLAITNEELRRAGLLLRVMLWCRAAAAAVLLVGFVLGMVLTARAGNGPLGVAIHALVAGFAAVSFLFLYAVQGSAACRLYDTVPPERVPRGIRICSLALYVIACAGLPVAVFSFFWQDALVLLALVAVTLIVGEFQLLHTLAPAFRRLGMRIQESRLRRSLRSVRWRGLGLIVVGVALLLAAVTSAVIVFGGEPDLDAVKRFTITAAFALMTLVIPIAAPYLLVSNLLWLMAMLGVVRGLTADDLMRPREGSGQVGEPDHRVRIDGFEEGAEDGREDAADNHQ